LILPWPFCTHLRINRSNGLGIFSSSSGYQTPLSSTTNLPQNTKTPKSNISFRVFPKNKFSHSYQHQNPFFPELCSLFYAKPSSP